MPLLRFSRLRRSKAHAVRTRMVTARTAATITNKATLFPAFFFFFGVGASVDVGADDGAKLGAVEGACVTVGGGVTGSSPPSLLSLAWLLATHQMSMDRSILLRTKASSCDTHDAANTTKSAHLKEGNGNIPQTQLEVCVDLPIGNTNSYY